MNPALLIPILQLAAQAIPEIQKAFKSGEITPEEQAKLLAEYNNVKDLIQQPFTGPEWEVTK